MKLSIFTTVTDPTKRGDAWRPALECYTQLADEVMIVNGGIEEVVDDYIHNSAAICEFGYGLWPKEFSWEYIGKQFQLGYTLCTGDWVLHCDIDFIFHEADYEAIRKALVRHNDAPALSFYKWQFTAPYKYNLKSRLVIAVNKGKYGDRIRFDSGGDLCQPSLDGKELRPDDVPESQIKFFNYEKVLKTEAQIRDDVGRMARAWQRHFGDYKLGGPDDQSAYDEWYKMTSGRFAKPQTVLHLTDHPKVMQPVLSSLTPEQWGYSGFGLFKPHYIV